MDITANTIRSRKKGENLKIEQIDMYRISMPLIYPFRTAFGDNQSIETILVKISDASEYGWGESAPWTIPAYSPECARTCFIVIRQYLAPLLIGKNIETGIILQKHLDAIRGNQFAKAALDQAWWDLYAKKIKKPLWKVLGGQSPLITVGADFGVMESIDELLETICEAMNEGFKRVKLKYRPGWELDMVKSVRNAFPDLTVHIDCNSAYSLVDLPMFKELEIGACRWINIKPGRVGGLTNAVSIHNLSQEAGIPCWVGGMLESSLGAHQCMALATMPNIKYPSDIFPSKRFYKNDLSTPPVVLSGVSTVRAPDSPGCGAEPDHELLKRMCIERAVVSIDGTS
jgi:O-succinylbenzoate synthase